MFCFDKTRRLRNKNDYEHVFSAANKTITPEFVILHCKNSLGYARLGLALSKKKIAKANQRNRLKRLLRESFRVHDKLPAVDMIFLARQGVAKIENYSVTANLGKAWEKLINFYEH